MKEDFCDLLVQRTDEAPDRLMLAWEPFDGVPAEWTRQAFLRAVQRVAGGLQARGVQPGQRVLLHAQNCPQFLVLWCACAWIGAVCVVLNPKSAADELRHFAEATGAVGLVTQRGLPAAPEAGFAGLRWVQAFDAHDALDGLAGADAPRAARVPAAPEAPLCMLFTSGTSARPKAVVWTRANARWACEAGCRAAALGPSDVMQVCLPLYHVVGLAWSVLPAIAAGAAIVLQPRFSASRFWPVAIRRRATVAWHVQFSSGVLSRQPVPAGHGFRLWCNSTWIEAYERHFGIPIVGGWGMTELVAPGILGDLARRQGSGTIGRAAPGYALRLAGSSAAPAPGQAGELEVRGTRGQTIFAGYWNDEAATAEAFTADGWFRTGDRVAVDADGAIRFVERARDVIKTGGEGVSPAEVERTIREVPGVAEVSLVGRADATLGEVGVAFVVAAPDAAPAAELGEAIDAHCRSCLAAFKVPREIRFIAALPLVGINKVAKGELRRQAQHSPPVGSRHHA